MLRYLSRTLLHLYMKYESCMLKTTQVIVSEQKCWLSLVVTFYCVRTKVLTKFSCDLHRWSIYPKLYMYLPFTILHLRIKYESCTLNTTQFIVSEQKCWLSKFSCDLHLWPIDPKMYRYLSLTILHPKLVCNCCVIEVFGGVFVLSIRFWIFCWYRGFCHRTESDLLLSLYLWNMKAVRWKLLKLLCQNKSVD